MGDQVQLIRLMSTTLSNLAKLKLIFAERHLSQCRL